jgi:hypothetical protein
MKGVPAFSLGYNQRLMTISDDAARISLGTR